MDNLPARYNYTDKSRSAASGLDDEEKKLLLDKCSNLVSFEKLMNGHQITEEEALVWALNYPFTMQQAKDIVQTSMRVPRSIVQDYIFPGYEMNQEEADMFDVLAAFGRAHGVVLVSKPLFEGAEQGDPRAVKMYMELLRLLDPDKNEEEEAALRKLMRVSIEL